MNSEQNKNKNIKNDEEILKNPPNSILLGKDKNGNMMYQLGRFIVSYLNSSSEDLCGLCESETERLKKEKSTEKKEKNEKVSN